MAITEENGSRGFTLVELMVVVAIIGILASVAIPSFVNYQLTSKRAEAFANLSALAKAQKAYYAEFNTYVSVPSEPSGALSLDPTTTKRDKTPIEAAFSTVGWTPDGDVFFDYDTVTPDSVGAPSCRCTEACFTASAYGNLDGDATMSVLLYAQPDSAGDDCDTYLAGQQSVPVVGGARQHSSVVRVLAADDF